MKKLVVLVLVLIFFCPLVFAQDEKKETYTREEYLRGQLQNIQLNILIRQEQINRLTDQIAVWRAEGAKVQLELKAIEEAKPKGEKKKK